MKKSVSTLWSDNKRIATIEETESTNSDLLALAKQGLAEGLWLQANRQSRGRGRQGRTWQLPEGNLAISTLVRLRESDPSPSTLAFVAALALDQAASDFVRSDWLSLKWPNDLMLKGAKCAGILLEGYQKTMIVGFGVNLLHAPENLDRPTSALVDFTEKPLERLDFSEKLANAFCNWLCVWRNQGLTSIYDNWLKRAHNLNTPLTVHQENGKNVTGYFAGLDLTGALKLRLEDNRIVLFHSGDVFLAKS
ncbi:MAG: biotin--[acetyl-CoA-carboxylase] ligase [Zymomonas mobilis subsp. pomaceae]|nr:biotin--[acetyl-CoA-carboxylase] ligase [Zymomonas mobilis]MDX5949512.1 biotin--[acetyl-CoA-carboxylase] ligase [Zymomonas mobilis subsp. pomaceae]GEB89255.1 biotin--[acetyl-CoA-carboxylase] ligase [Zymomonas mobilis subsp. pomaceae]